MCDTLIALGKATKDGSVVFGKNSDREPDEVQNLVIQPAQTHPANSTVKCTYIEVPQVEQTHRVLLSKPFWMFGAEMGANEHGVVIGNEALFTKLDAKEPALTGMDLLRLALERTTTAVDARETIITLLEEYGQGGQCGYRNDLFYMNGFIIADRKEAFILETVEKEWAWKKVQEIASMSNAISLEQDFDEVSSHLIEKAIAEGWAKSKEDFNFYNAYSDKIITWGAAGKDREECAYNLLEKHQGEITPQVMASILRSHDSEDEPRAYKPNKGLKGTICKHAANSLTRPDSAVNALIGHLTPGQEIYYTTGASNPCLSPFFPLAVSSELPKGYNPGGEVYNAEKFWWQSELINRRALWNYWGVRDIIDPDLTAYEEKMFEECWTFMAQKTDLSQAQINEYFETVQGLVETWTNKTEAVPKVDGGLIFKRFWKKYNRLNQIPE